MTQLHHWALIPHLHDSLDHLIVAFRAETMPVDINGPPQPTVKVLGTIATAACGVETQLGEQIDLQWHDRRFCPDCYAWASKQSHWAPSSSRSRRPEGELSDDA